MNAPGSTSGLRAANREAVVRLLRTRGPMSQADLARASGLSPATISSLARELRDDGWLDDGRELRLSRHAGVAVGIDFGHSHVRVAVADLGHEVLGEDQAPIDVDHEASEGIELAGTLVERVLAEAGTGLDRVMGVGMGLPGPLRWRKRSDADGPARGTGEVGDSAIMPGWIGTRPEALMSERLGIAVRVDNDANLGALAETVWGAGRGCQDVVYVKAATGIGAGLVLGGVIYRGAAGTAGEIGHMTVDEAGPVCRCGNRGCLEAVAGADAVVEPLRRRHGDALALHDVIARAREGDHGCARVLEDAGRALGLVLAGVCNLLAPERVVLGGELAGAGELVLEPIAAMVRRSGIGAVRETPVVAGVLGERAEVLGAIALVLRESRRYVAEPA
jgi:predicted NBD/HSP70 family sugar kinase